MKSNPDWVRRGLAPAGGLLFVLGERVWSGEPARPFLTGLGAAFLLALVLWRAWGWWRAAPGVGAREVAAWAAAPPALFAAAAGIYLAGLLLPESAGGGADWASLIGWGWALAVLLGVALYVFLELATRGGAIQPDAGRIGRAAYGGLFLGLLLALVATTNFVVDRLGYEWDLTFFRASAPSEATREMIEGLGESVEVALVFAEDSPTLPLVKNYFRLVENMGAKLKVTEFDADLEPAKARTFRVRGNGSVALRSRQSRKQFSIGTTVARARRNLAKLDASFLGALVEVGGEKKIAYFTVGHGELTSVRRSRERVSRSQRQFRDLLREKNFQVKNLGIGEGLGTEVPQDAGLVIVMAPTAAFLPGEILALRDYLEQGGRLLVFLEPYRNDRERPTGGAGDITSLLAEYGMVFQSVALANDRVFVRYSYSKADHGLLVTSKFPNHPIHRAGRRGRGSQKPLLLLGSGGWSKGKTRPGLQVRPVVNGMPGTWGDRNGNFTFDRQSERKFEPIVALSVNPRKKAAKGETPAGPHILGFADSDVALDFLMQNPANKQMLAGAIRWVAGSETPAGLGTTGEDIRILHAKRDEVVWFYLPVFGVPLLVLALGYLVSFRRRHS